MQQPGSSTVLTERQRLENRWRLRLEEASSRYKIAKASYRKILGEQSEAASHDVDATGALIRSREEESDALAEYRRIVRMFTGLITGEKPSSIPVGPIAVVDDDESVRESMKSLLRSAGYGVRTFAAAEEFIDAGVGPDIACLVLDVRMPGIDGLELQRRLNDAHSAIPIVFITAHDDGPARQRAINAGAVDVLHKPFAASVLLAIVATAIKRWRSGAQQTEE